MANTDLQSDLTGVGQEKAKQAPTVSTGVLDGELETLCECITQLASEYFHADTVLLKIADEARAWVKSSCGQPIRELRQLPSLLDALVSENGPVSIAHADEPSGSMDVNLEIEREQTAFPSGVPIHDSDGAIVGTLAVFNHDPRRTLDARELRMLDCLADMVAGQLELRRLRRTCSSPHRARPRMPVTIAPQAKGWPQPHDLCRALERREFVLYYQPEVDLSTRKIVGVEALIRWKHPERGLIPPGEVIPLAEETGIILPIGDWGLAEACAQIQKWCTEDRSRSSLRVLVNLSVRQFSRPGLADHVESLLLRHGIRSRQLGLEMTESSLIPNMEIALEVLGSLHSLGVSLLMDDFGTGYSSLNNLHTFPFDVLKIDRSFVGRMTEGDQPLQIVRTIIELARVLGMDVVAEGIETREQYRLLRQMGCRFGQGFLFARPMTAEAVGHLLRLPGRVIPEPGEIASMNA